LKKEIDCLTASDKKDDSIVRIFIEPSSTCCLDQTMLKGKAEDIISGLVYHKSSVQNFCELKLNELNEDHFFESILYDGIIFNVLSIERG